MKELTFKCWAKAQIAKQQIKENVKDLFSEEKGGADSLIIAIVLIVIVVAIAVIFKDQIGAWVNSLFGEANAELSNVNDVSAVSTVAMT